MQLSLALSDGSKEDPALFSEMTRAASEAYFFERMIFTLSQMLDAPPSEYIEQRVTATDL